MLETIALGLVQGITEFLPVSSSGHLVIFEHLLGVHSSDFSLEIALHLGTLLSVLVYFRVKILSLFKGFFSRNFEQSKSEKTYVLYLILATIPTAFIGIFFKDYFNAFKSDLSMVGMALMFTALLLFLANIRMRKPSNKKLGWMNCIFIGIMQGIAIIPGVSRSGSTVVGGLLQGVNAKEVAEFSFLLSIPAILGAFVLDFQPGFVFSPQIILGMLASFVSGLVAIHVFLKIISQGKLNIFGFYCLFVGVMVVFII